MTLKTRDILHIYRTSEIHPYGPNFAPPMKHIKYYCAQYRKYWVKSLNEVIYWRLKAEDVFVFFNHVIFLSKEGKKWYFLATKLAFIDTIIDRICPF